MQLKFKRRVIFKKKKKEKKTIPKSIYLIKKAVAVK